MSDLTSPPYALKILSGELAGVEYLLAPGDWVFRVGPPRELLDGSTAAMMSHAGNAYFIPDASRRGRFIVRIPEPVRLAGRPPPPQLGVVAANDGVTFHPIAVNTLQLIEGIDLAVKPPGEAWSAAVLDFRAPQHVPDVPISARDNAARRRRSRWFAAVAALICLLVAGWAYRHFNDNARTSSLAESLGNAPEATEVRRGGDGELYVFTDSDKGAYWAQLALQRLGEGAQVVSRTQATGEIGMFLKRQQIDFVVVRMLDPIRPELVLSGTDMPTQARSERITALLKAQFPYIEALQVTSMSDHQLIELAQAGLRQHGIEAHIDGKHPQPLISNSAYLDDARLHTMTVFITNFHRQWGNERIGFRVRLWNDLLQGRSYRYDASQLLSVGDGAWQFSSQHL